MILAAIRDQSHNTDLSDDLILFLDEKELTHATNHLCHSRWILAITIYGKLGMQFY